MRCRSVSRMADWPQRGAGPFVSIADHSSALRCARGTIGPADAEARDAAPVVSVEPLGGRPAAAAGIAGWAVARHSTASAAALRNRIDPASGIGLCTRDLQHPVDRVRTATQHVARNGYCPLRRLAAFRSRWKRSMSKAQAVRGRCTPSNQPLEVDRDPPAELHLPVVGHVVVLELEEVLDLLREREGQAAERIEPAPGA